MSVFHVAVITLLTGSVVVAWCCRGRRKYCWDKMLMWFTPARALAVIFLILGAMGVIDGPVPYPPIKGLAHFHTNIAPELLGIAITVLFIDYANDRRLIQQEKRALILQMGSPNNALAREAVRQLRARGWLVDGTLNGAYLAGANLSNENLRESTLERANLQDAKLRNTDFRGDDTNLAVAYLMRAQLQKAKLNDANLSGANLYRAVLEDAFLSGTQLQGADFTEADLSKATFLRARLQGAILREANVSGANFHKADLTGADLTRAENVDSAQCDMFTVLPDGTEYTPGRSFREFI